MSVKKRQITSRFIIQIWGDFSPIKSTSWKTSLWFNTWWLNGLQCILKFDENNKYFITFSRTVGSFWVVIYEGFYPYPRVITLPYPWWLAPTGTLPFNTLWKNLKPYPPLTLWRVRVRVYPRVTPLTGRKSPP